MVNKAISPKFDAQSEQVTATRFKRESMINTISRRAAIGTTALGAMAYGFTASGDEPNEIKQWTLEGELKVHPKFLYRFYLTLLDGQRCALFGAQHEREPASLTSITLPARVRVQGVLGTAQHSGGSKDAPSPFPAGWIVFMDVRKVELLVEKS